MILFQPHRSIRICPDYFADVFFMTIGYVIIIIPVKKENSSQEF